MIDVTNKVRVYYDGAEPKEKEHVIVESAFLGQNMIYLTVGDKKVKVCARDLKAALENALNVVRY